jgi:hypothetical protein
MPTPEAHEFPKETAVAYIFVLRPVREPLSVNDIEQFNRLKTGSTGFAVDSAVLPTENTAVVWRQLIKFPTYISAEDIAEAKAEVGI